MSKIPHENSRQQILVMKNDGESPLHKLSLHPPILAVCGKEVYREHKLFLMDRFFTIGSKIVVRTPGAREHDLIAAAESLNPKTLIAVGGGSLMDFVKIARCRSESLRHANFICVPTTAGSGAEATPFATVWGSKKESLFSDEMLSSRVIFCPRLLSSCSDSVSFAAFGDAISQAFESFCSNRATFRSREIAGKALKRLRFSGTPFQSDEYSILARQRGAYLSGAAIRQTNTMAIHALSYPLTTRFKIPHGYAVTLLLSSTADLFLNKVNLPDLHADFLAFIGNPDEWLEFFKVPRRLLGDLGLPSRLSQFGVRDSDFERMAQEALLSDRMANSPRILKNSEIHRIYSEIF